VAAAGGGKNELSICRSAPPLTNIWDCCRHRPCVYSALMDSCRSERRHQGGPRIISSTPAICGRRADRRRCPRGIERWVGSRSRRVEALFDLPLGRIRTGRARVVFSRDLGAELRSPTRICLRSPHSMVDQLSMGRELRATPMPAYCIPEHGSETTRSGLIREASPRLLEKSGLDRFRARVYMCCGSGVILGAPGERRPGRIRRALETALETGDYN